jgi:hypothetical protein
MRGASTHLIPTVHQPRSQHGEEGEGPLTFGCCTQHALNMVSEYFFLWSYWNVPIGRPGVSTTGKKKKTKGVDGTPAAVLPVEEQNPPAGTVSPDGGGDMEKGSTRLVGCRSAPIEPAPGCCRGEIRTSSDRRDPDSGAEVARAVVMIAAGPGWWRRGGWRFTGHRLGARRRVRHMTRTCSVSRGAATGRRTAEERVCAAVILILFLIDLTF